MVARRVWFVERHNVDVGEESVDRDGEGEGEECVEDGEEEDGRSLSLRSLVDCFGFSG